MKIYTIIDYIFGIAFFILTMLQTNIFIVIITDAIASIFIAKAYFKLSFDEFIQEAKMELGI